MKTSTREWIAKAEEDFALATTLARPRTKPLWGPLSFHAQQCAEKYLKARLNEAGLPIQRTHDLVQLLNQALQVESLWAAFAPSLQQLSNYGVQPRYPGYIVTKTEAKEALRICRDFRREARAALGL